MTLAVGGAARERQLRAISCKLNGLFFFVSQGQASSASQMRTALDRWYQMLAVPLAARQAAGQLKPTWTRPYLARSGQEVHLTVGLPCLVDLSSDSPQLVGAVAFDVAVLPLPTPAPLSWRESHPALQLPAQVGADLLDTPPY